MITIVDTHILHGYTGVDHLIDAAAEAAVAGHIGRSYRDAASAARAVRRTYEAVADRRVHIAPIRLVVVASGGAPRELRA